MLQSPRILLVSPRFNPNSFWSFQGTVELQGARSLAPPLGLITVAAMLPDHWTLRLIDRNVESLTLADITAADLVMTGGMLPQEPDTLAIMALCAKAGVPVCVGGPAPSSTPAAYEHADFLVIGEAEGVIDAFVADWEAGRRQGRYTAEKFKADVTTTPAPRFDLLTFRHYAWVNVQFSRGCPFTCEFCDIIELYGRAPRTKTPPQMLAELDRLMALGYRGHVDFVDDNLIGNKKAIKAFLPALREWQERHRYPFKFSTEASLNLADDEELLVMMRRANFFALFTGIETPDEATLRQTGKKQNTRRSIAGSVHRIYAAGMYVAAGFIVGFDEEHGTVAPAMSACIADTGIPTATIGLLTALPNTGLSRRLASEGRLLDGFRKTMTESGDMCTAGLNFETLRPRRDIMQDYRDVVAAAYAPDQFFGRVRSLGRRLNAAYFRRQRLHWPTLGRDLLAFVRLSVAMTVSHPELARLYWGTLYDCLRHHPIAFEGVVRNIAHYVHLYPFSRYVIRTVEARIAEIDAGTWGEALASPASDDGPMVAVA